MLKPIELFNERTGLSLGNEIYLASTFRTRLIGLLGRSSLKPGQGMLIERCNQVHMLFMRFEIGIVFLSPEWKIVGLEPCLKTWTISSRVEDASSVLELPLGVIESTGCQLGDLLVAR